MQNRKRSVDNVLSLDDERDSVLPHRKMARRDADLDDHTIDDVVEDREESFKDFIANNVPLGMIDDDLKEYLITRSNNLLDQAREEGVDLKDISIGQNCLPVWPMLSWDPSIEPLRSMIERYMDDLEVNQHLGKLIRDDIIAKGNQKLEAARELGLTLDRIIIGNSLLPELLTLIAEDVGEEPSIDDQDDSQLSSQTITPSSLPTAVDDDTGNLLDSSLWESFARSYRPVPKGLDSDSPDSDSLCSYDDPESDDGFPHIAMNNFVDDQAYYSDGSVGYFYDAHVVGAPQGHLDIDFEFHIAFEDDEVENLPEMEFAVDEEAFNRYFETDEAIKIEVPGVQIRCTGHIDFEEVVEPIETMRVEDEEEEEADIPTNHRVRFAQSPTMISPSPVRSSPSASDDTAQRDDSLNIIVDHGDDESVASEEVTSDEEENNGIPEEVDGVFNW